VGYSQRSVEKVAISSIELSHGIGVEPVKMGGPEKLAATPMLAQFLPAERGIYAASMPDRK
jgi:hypothetical protein